MTEPDLLTQLRESEQRLQSLLRVSSSFATALNPEDVYETVIREGKTTLGARAGAVTLVKGDTLTIVAFHGHEPRAIEVLRHQPVTATYPVAEAIRTRQALFFHTAAERLHRYPHLQELFNSETKASAYLPLLLNGEVIGALTLSFPTQQGFDATTREFLNMLTDTCAQTLNRTLLFERTKVSEQRFRGLFENTLDAILLANQEGHIIAANSSAEALFGYSQEEFLSLSVPHLFVASEREHLATIGKKNHYDEWLLLCKDGTERWAEMSCQIFEDGHSQAVVRDITERKKAQIESQLLTKELETEKTILDTILRTAPVGFTFLTKDLRYSHTNEALADMNGIPAAQHLGRTLYDIVPDLAPKIEETFRGVLESGESLSLELKGETQKHPGVTRCWQEDIYRVDNASGETLGLGVMVQEITERKREELNGQLLLELSGVTRFLSTPDDIEYSVSRALGEHLSATNCTFTEVSVAEGTVTVKQQWSRAGAKDLVGTYKLEDFVLPELMIEYLSGLTVAIDDITNDPRTSPYKENFASLGIAAMAVVPYLEEGVWTGTLTVTCNTPHTWREDEVELLETVLKQYYPVLERLRTQVALHESEALFRTLAEALPGFVWMDGEGGTNLYMNPRWEEFTGQGIEAARAGGWREVTHPDDIPRIAQRWAWSHKTGEAYEMELRHRHRDGSYHWFLAKGLPVHDSNGTITRWVGTSIDIQEQKETLEALQESETRFRELANGLPQFVWTLGNDKNRLEYINEPWLTYTGQTLEQALTNANDVIHPDVCRQRLL